MLKTLTLLLCAAVALVGCKKDGPDVSCSAEPTKALVSNIFFDTTNKLLKKEGYPEISKDKLTIELLTITTSKLDKDLNKYECNAQLFIPIAKGSSESEIMDEVVTNPDLKTYAEHVDVAADGIKTKITYTSQTTDDQKEQLVEIEGLDAISLLVTIIEVAKHTQYAAAKANDTSNTQGYSNCSPNSKILFSCFASNGKQIEVCDAGEKIEYAFGLPEAMPDIIVKAPRNTVRAYGDPTGTSYSIDIPNGDTNYSAFWGFNRYSDEHETEAGVQVYSKGQLLVTVNCAGENIVNNIYTVVNASE